MWVLPNEQLSLSADKTAAQVAKNKKTKATARRATVDKSLPYAATGSAVVGAGARRGKATKPKKKKK